MAVGRLSGAWILRVLATRYPDGVTRRALLDHFAESLVARRSSRGAKGRLARRLYGTLLKLQRRGLILQAEGVVRTQEGPLKVREGVPPDMGPVLERWLFKALLAEDGQGDGHTPEELRKARQCFVSEALAAGWTPTQAASALGLGSPGPSSSLRIPDPL